jgi:hypothetical protein
LGRHQILLSAVVSFLIQNTEFGGLAYVYFEDEPGRRSVAKLLSKDEARRIAANIAALPVFIRE